MIDHTQRDQSKDFYDFHLPSGTKWGVCNLGAQHPWESGNYYAWGETEPKEKYTEENYTCKATGDIQATEFDAAYVHDRRTVMPNKEQWEELLECCTWTWVESYQGHEVKGYEIWPEKSKILEYCKKHNMEVPEYWQNNDTLSEDDAYFEDTPNIEDSPYYN